MRPKGSQSWAPRRRSTCCASSPRRGRKSCGSSARSCLPRCRRMLVDAHAHLDAYSDRAEVVARAKAAGLVHVVAVETFADPFDTYLSSPVVAQCTVYFG